MKKTLYLIFISMALLCIQCGGGSSSATGDGGPSIISENPVTENDTPASSSDLNNVIDQGLTPDNAQAESSDNPTALEQDVTQESPDGVQQADTGSINNPGPPIENIVLATPGEGWLNTGNPVNVVSPELYSSTITHIQEYQNLIDSLQQKIEGSSSATLSADDIASINAQIENYQNKIEKLRDTIGYSQETGGIVTSSNTPLEITISGITEAGWYEIAVNAKNLNGELPDWYEYFLLNVSDSSGTSLGGIFIEANDSLYRRGTVSVYLEPGTQTLSLTWINPAHGENYDTNLNINSITVRPVQSGPALTSLERSAFMYSSIDGTVYWTNEALLMFWDDQTVGYTFKAIEPGRYEVTLEARNKGDLPQKYTHFVLSLDTDSSTGEIKIPASSKKYQQGKGQIDIFDSDAQLFVTWRNDVYENENSDTNILIRNISLKRVGDTKSSALTAFLIGMGKKTGSLLIGFIIIMSLIGVLIIVKRRKGTSV